MPRRPSPIRSAKTGPDHFGAVTMCDIAKHLGISQPVVSKALYGGRTSVRVSAPLLERIRATANELGYRPNAAARTLTRRRFASVTLVQYTYRNWSYLPQLLLESVVDSLAAQGLGLAVQRCDHDGLGDVDAPPRLLQQSEADGLLINVNHTLGAPLRERFLAQRVPAIWLNGDHGGDCVLPDDHAAGHDLTETMLAAGSHRIRYLGLGINPAENHLSKSARPDGYAEAMRTHGRCPEIILGSKGVDVRAQVAAACAEEPGDWIVYGNSEAEMLIGLANEHGWRLGRDLRLALFTPPHGNLRSLSWLCAEEPLVELGRVSVNMLVRKIADPTTTLPTCRLPWRITPSRTAT